jgi:SAM-dependent methyltransferase
MSITVERFYDLLIEEIKQYPQLQGYYRFLNDPKKELWRKAYFCQRLDYIARRIQGSSNTWDIGCGYATTCIFLALNGYKVHGSTLEYYFKEIPERLKYWSQYGDLSLFTYDYSDLYESKISNTYDTVIVQDTLHHTEPIEQALQIINRALVDGGRVIAVEENGSNVIQRAKLYKQRGNKRIIEMHDERLNKTILLGNENIRSQEHWTNLFNAAGYTIEQESIEYVRVLPSFLFGNDYQKAIEKEQRLWRSNGLLKKYFFFGLSFCALKV